MHVDVKLSIYLVNFIISYKQCNSVLRISEGRDRDRQCKLGLYSIYDHSIVVH